MLPLFSDLTLFLAFAVHLAALAGPEAGLSVWVFFRAVKAGSQPLTHRKPVRTIEVTLGRSESWQTDLRRLLH